MHTGTKLIKDYLIIHFWNNFNFYLSGNIIFKTNNLFFY